MSYVVHNLREVLAHQVSAHAQCTHARRLFTRGATVGSYLEIPVHDIACVQVLEGKHHFTNVHSRRILYQPAAPVAGYVLTTRTALLYQPQGYGASVGNR